MSSWLASIFLAMGLVTVSPSPVSAEPTIARPYAHAITREARLLFGMRAPVAMFGAQIQTESGWKPRAHSAYANGLAQFIPSTEAYMKQRYPRQLGAGGAMNPEWSIRALILYDRELYDPIVARSDCDRWAFALSAYNGGPGWIPRDRALCSAHSGCDTTRWWGNVERYTSRSASNAAQNREYPRRILLDYQPAYKNWGGFVSCR